MFEAAFVENYCSQTCKPTNVYISICLISTKIILISLANLLLPTDIDPTNLNDSTVDHFVKKKIAGKLLTY